MRFAELARVSQEVAATSKRTEKTELLARVIERLGEDEIEAGVSFLSGAVRQEALGVGFATLSGPVPDPVSGPQLDVADVHEAFEAIADLSGEGSTRARTEAVAALLARATPAGQQMLIGLMAGELRQGAQAGLVQDAVAKAFDLPPGLVRRAVMLTGDLGHTAFLARHAGSEGLESVRLEVGRPVYPMLASTAESTVAALERTGPASVELKLDGARIQVHKRDGVVKIYSRNLRDITNRLPVVVEIAAGLTAGSLVLDGEAISLDASGRPVAFQDTASALGTEIGETGFVLRPFFFDVLHLEGDDLIDTPLEERWHRLEALVPEHARVGRISTDDPVAAEEFFQSVVAQGHEGVVAKSLDSAYQAGRRGKAWVKVKPVHTLDLVVLAAEWGSGRRTGWLSNLHLGARDPETGEFIMLGKTFKGLTDDLLRWQTGRLQELKLRETHRTVFVRPEQVVEIAFDGVQRSTRYPGGVALRFARVKRYRDDKDASGADTIDTVRSYL